MSSSNHSKEKKDDEMINHMISKIIDIEEIKRPVSAPPPGLCSFDKNEEIVDNTKDNILYRQEYYYYYHSIKPRDPRLPKPLWRPPVTLYNPTEEYLGLNNYFPPNYYEKDEKIDKITNDFHTINLNEEMNEKKNIWENFDNNGNNIFANNNPKNIGFNANFPTNNMNFNPNSYPNNNLLLNNNINMNNNDMMNNTNIINQMNNNNNMNLMYNNNNNNLMNNDMNFNNNKMNKKMPNMNNPMPFYPNVTPNNVFPQPMNMNSMNSFNFYNMPMNNQPIPQLGLNTLQMPMPNLSMPVPNQKKMINVNKGVKQNLNVKSMPIKQDNIVDNQNQNGSRILQQHIESGNEIEFIFANIQHDTVSLMKDVFGNYVIQKLIERGSNDIKSKTVESIKGNIKELSIHTYGCRVIQKIIELIKQLPESQEIIIHELEPYVIECIFNQNGNHVIQKCFENIPSSKLNGFIDRVIQNMDKLAIHTYGCRKHTTRKSYENT